MDQLELSRITAVYDTYELDPRLYDAPPPTSDRSHPVGHGRFAATVVGAVSSWMRITDVHHALMSKDLEYFGIGRIEAFQKKWPSEYSPLLAWRQSHQRRLQSTAYVGIAVNATGTVVIVHTIPLTLMYPDYLLRVESALVKACDTLFAAVDHGVSVFEQLKSIKMHNILAPYHMTELMRNTALKTTMFPRVLEQWYEPPEEYRKHRNTAWLLVNLVASGYKAEHTKGTGTIRALIERSPHLLSYAEGLIAEWEQGPEGLTPVQSS